MYLVQLPPTGLVWRAGHVQPLLPVPRLGRHAAHNLRLALIIKRVFIFKHRESRNANAVNVEGAAGIRTRALVEAIDGYTLSYRVVCHTK